MARNDKGNVILEEGFSQVCIWPATVVGETRIKEFVQFIEEELNARAQFLEEVLTLPDQNEFGTPIEGTGGRNDVIFAVHTDDIGRFAVPRLNFGIRWIEDVYDNAGGQLYEPRIAAYKSW